LSRTLQVRAAQQRLRAVRNHAPFDLTALHHNVEWSLTSCGTGAGDRQLVYLTPDISDTSTIKRAEEFIGQGYAVTVVGFRRDRYNGDYDPPWPHVLLGHTADGKYGQRAWAMLAALRALTAKRSWLRHTAILYCRNIDQLVLAVLARALFCRDALLAYEMLDIQPIQVGHGPISLALRAIERFCLRRVRVVVVSSPAFMRDYFLPVQHYRKEWFLLENKVHPSARSLDRGAPTGRRRRARGDAGYKWVVGYFGLIRGRQTVDLMTRLAARLRGTVLFKFRGVLTTVDHDYFATALASNENMVYEGDYVNPRDLGQIYGEVDLAWALDLEHIDHNSRWLLPCRFYEAGLYGVPCLAIRDFEIGRLIDRLNVGWTFAEPLEDALVRFFENLTPDDHARKRQRLLAMPRSAFVADDDVAALCEIFEQGIGKLAAAPMNPVVGRSL
jgi:succinoglycan biosynthesis protein ExoL